MKYSYFLLLIALLLPLQGRAQEADHLDSILNSLEQETFLDLIDSLLTLEEPGSELSIRMGYISKISTAGTWGSNNTGYRREPAIIINRGCSAISLVT